MNNLKLLTMQLILALDGSELVIAETTAAATLNDQVLIVSN
jgi:hypothetical protein